MSEAERRRRLEYRKRREKWIFRFTAIFAVLVVMASIFSIFSAQLNRERFINYKETSKIEYGVYVKDNDFYEDSYLGKEFEYVASLIDKVAAEYIYDLYIESATSTEFEYTYRIDATLDIKSKTSGRTIFSSVDEIVPAKTLTGSGREVTIRENVLLDYVEYNKLASEFIAKYGLKETESNLALQMHVDIIGSSSEFGDGENSTSYVASLDIPLTTKTVDVRISSKTPNGNGRIAASGFGTVGVVFRILQITFISITLLHGLALIAFIYLTRNTDITYEIKVKRLLKNYKSYIQKLINDFDTDGYKILQLDTFSEMLEIRDIIQSPILMSENNDKTKTVFLIPTDTKHLYMYEIKVEDYDELYGTPEGDGEVIVLTEVEEIEEETPVAPVEEEHEDVAPITESEE